MSTTTQIDQAQAVRHGKPTSDKRLFNVIFTAAFLVFVVGFAFARLLPGRGSVWAHGNRRARGVIEKARAEANMLASFALMH